MREGTDKTHTWIVDPLDGTTNFLHGIPHFAISIALEREGTIVAGLIYNPANDEIFTAERGKGAFLNDRRIRVAARKRLADAVVCCGLPHHGRGDLGAVPQRACGGAGQGRRVCGASAPPRSISLGSRPAGSTAYWERGLSPWDLAAGIVIGARGRRLRHRSRRHASDMIKAGDIIAGNEDMHRELLGAERRRSYTPSWPHTAEACAGPPASF